MKRNPPTQSPQALSEQQVGLLLPPDSRIARAIGHLDSDQAKLWAGMTADQRAKALQRIAALDRYCAEGSDLSAKQAAADAGVQLGRFYQMARRWRNDRSLHSIGAYASATRPRQRIAPDVTNALQAVVSRVVDADAGASVAKLSDRLAAASGLPAESIPTRNTLRLFIERELRRRQQRSLAGAALLFDLSATSLLRSDGQSHFVFLLIDKGSRLILGHAEGERSDSVSGYRAAAKDALQRLSEHLAKMDIWSARMDQPNMIPGTDGDALRSTLDNVGAELGSAAPQLAVESSQGVYIRRQLGLKLGTVRLMPGRTSPLKTETAPNSYSLSEAHARIEVAVAEHNEAALQEFSLKGEAEPPGELVRMLELMSRD